jgi:hypothetical protein
MLCFSSADVAVAGSTWSLVRCTCLGSMLCCLSQHPVADDACKQWLLPNILPQQSSTMQQASAFTMQEASARNKFG